MVANRRDSNKKKKRKSRAYSFKNSRKLPVERMTVVNGVPIPAMPGSCFHAILCALAEQKDRFCTWRRLVDRAQLYLRKYGGYAVWYKYVRKLGIKTFEKRIRDNTHTLTRSGKHCYGYRLHEMGMCIYIFRDGVFLFTGGRFTRKRGPGYSLEFNDGKTIQKRHKGLLLSRSEYRFLVSEGVINKSCDFCEGHNLKTVKRKLADMQRDIKGYSISESMALEMTFEQ